MKSKILNNTNEFGLDKILVDSFVRQVSETQQISAMDATYAISSLLEFPLHINAYNEKQQTENKSSNQISSNKFSDENVNSRNAQQ